MNPASSSVSGSAVPLVRHGAFSQASRERRFEHGRGVVADEADRAAGEARQARDERRLELRHQSPQAADERLVGLAGDAGSIDDRASAALAQDQKRILPEEGIARDLLAALDALEEKRVVGVLRDLQKRRHRRQQVGDDLLDHRHERSAPRQLDELLERCLLHACPLAVAT